MKDNCSSGAELYAKYRPSYPVKFYDLVCKLVNHKLRAWDCGTGNGQIAYSLSSYFSKVYATDISQAQLDHALPGPNIEYSLQAAEQTRFPDHFFDTIVVGQAIHWFDFDKFYAEVNRTLKADGVFFVVGYGLFKSSPEIDSIILNFYHTIIGPFWDKERHYIEEQYKTIPFPFEEIKVPSIENSYRWSFEQLIGYLNTWSAVKHFQKEKGYNPVEELSLIIKSLWGNAPLREIRFPLLLRIGTKRID